MDPRNSRPRADRLPASGQHFLKSRRLAAELVTRCEIAESDLVLEIGAGKGKFTEELGDRARMVVAVESDPSRAMILVERFKRRRDIIVVFGDALSVPLPSEPFRAFGNIPFGITSRLLRYLLDDPDTSLWRADLIVQLGAAIKRTRPRHARLQNMAWGPWWDFRMIRRIPAKAFEPMPSVEAAVLTVTKRNLPLLPTREREAFVGFLRQGFSGSRQLRTVLKQSLSRSQFRRLADDLGFPRDAQAIHLDLEQCVSLFRAVNPRQ